MSRRKQNAILLRIWKPWRRCEALREFSEAQARKLWVRSQIDRSTLAEFVWLLPWGFCFVGGVVAVLYLGERSNWSDARMSFTMAVAIIGPTPLLYFQAAGIIRAQSKSVRRIIESGAFFERVPECLRCGYTLLGIAREPSSEFSKAVCPECGDRTLLGDRDVRTLMLHEAAAKLEAEPTPSPPSSP